MTSRGSAGSVTRRTSGGYASAAGTGGNSCHPPAIAHVSWVPGATAGWAAGTVAGAARVIAGHAAGSQRCSGGFAHTSRNAG